MKSVLSRILTGIVLAASAISCLSAPDTDHGNGVARPVIYQLFLRQFSNTNEIRLPNGSLKQNGVGRFSDLNEAALSSLRRFGITHLWLLGVPRHATATDYSQAGLPADDPDLLKGVAGSPFAIRDYFDVSPDYADRPEQRLIEFRSLVERIHQAGMKVLVDCVPNHVARSYQSVVKPERTFGAGDDRTVFFSPNNNFFYLEGEPPLRLPTVSNGVVLSPTCQVLGGCDGLFAAELDHGKVTGNNVISWTPGPGDWYETVKLNYGFDFTRGREGLNALQIDDSPGENLPDTWLKMDLVLAHWQELGVDGFRCDMAHWIPMEFWRWALARARERQPGTLFVAEAYDNDPNKLTEGNVLKALVEAGFDAVYDDQSYDVLKEIYDGRKWANDLDDVLGTVAPLHQSLRYAENHDEVRLANPMHWGGHGAAVGRPVSAILCGIGQGPLLLYNGQEVGEPALGAEGFGGDDARTSIFDYWSMPEMVKWVNGHRYDGARLSSAQRELRAWYARLIEVTDDPVFRQGVFMGLNRHNRLNPNFGRLSGETASGHWLYAFLRHHRDSGRTFLVVVNLHGTETLRNVHIRFPDATLEELGWGRELDPVRFRDRLDPSEPLEISTRASTLNSAGLVVPFLAPLSALYLERLP